MSNLRRSLAPITPEAWEFIEEEARDVLNIKLTGRRAVDFIGPKGIDFAAVNTGRRVLFDDSELEGIRYFKRHVLPLIEVEVPFKMNLEEIESLVRGAEDVDTDPLIEAAEKVARAENEAIFYGMDEVSIEGLIDSSAQEVIDINEKEGIVSAVATGVKNLVIENIEGPYILLLGPKMFSMLYKLNEIDDKGYPTRKRLEELIEGKVIPAPVLGDKGILLSTRGEDFELIVGEDISIGFNYQDRDELEFFFLESFTFRVNTPEAIVVLK
ncbi:family 1 encapsulin nanocompartment shell protein [Orenia marismortui]|uniref:family 1 encapsulin nanocompartment shell protein n=1 Tax=Orenia marismortui TaxID=46469 RepID=UPI000378431E|nr:family 1 encapsulin nanocompartment shell protein [Orenia marismortui]